MNGVWCVLNRPHHDVWKCPGCGRVVTGTVESYADVGIPVCHPCTTDFVYLRTEVYVED